LVQSIPIRPSSPAQRVTPPWRPRHLLAAPHRLAFFLAMLVLMASGAWWALVQLQRGGFDALPGYALSPSLTHAAVMSFGFISLFFAGFLFTAGPRWLGVEGPSARAVLPSLAAQAAGWMLWLAGTHLHAAVAGAGLLLALAGMAAMTLRFWRLIARSPVPDQLHARSIGVALIVGCLCMAGLALALAFGAQQAAQRFVVTGLWGFVVVVYVAVAHRMIPFFTSSALPMLNAWRPGWVLALMLGMAGFEAAAVWVDMLLATSSSVAWPLARGIAELAAGAVLLWLAVAWGLVQSLKVRLLAMLHLGFLWLGLGLALGGVLQIAGALMGQPLMPLAALHAVTMGCLGSLMVAMVTRVSCGHSGRALVADNTVWALFWLLQAAVLARVAATVAGGAMQAWLTAAALLWAGVMLAWGLRHAGWYGRPRADGRPG
jgi:uncharacterized protein involved in response to NO